MSDFRLRVSAIVFTIVLLPGVGFATSPKEIATTVIEFMGDNGLAKKNDMELLKFAISRPSCAQTIYTHTIQQDYTLIATVAGMKVAKGGAALSVPGLGSFNQQQCHAMSPLQRLYTFVDATSDKFVPDAPGTKSLAKQYIDQGKTELEGKLTSVPFGDALKEWPCLCDAAFETDLSEEKFAADAYQKGVKLINAAQSGNVGKVVEIAIAEFGVELGCSLGVEFSQVGHIPVVGEAAFTACSELGKAVGWLVESSWNAGIAIGEALSGQTEHMPVEKYYETFWTKYLHEDTLVELRFGNKPDHKLEYDACVGYFDSHKASASSAKQWCGDMRKDLAFQVSALIAAFKPVPASYYNDVLKPQVPKLVLEHYKLIVPQTDFNTATFGGNPGPSTQCNYTVKNAIPIDGPHPWSYPGGPKGMSPPLTAWSWACMNAMDMFKAAALDYRAKQVPQLISWMNGQGCVVAEHPGNQLRFRCETMQAYVACRDNLVGSVTDPLKHCAADDDAVAKMMAQIAAELGPKRCAVGPNKKDVGCTRPWKVEKCEALIKQYAPGVTFASMTAPSCYLKPDAQFDAAVIEAQGMLDIMNGVDPSAPSPGTSGASQPIFSQGKPCKHTFDPLSLTCTTPAPLQKLPDGLPICPPDPNQDGADAPCYDGPVTEGTPGPVAANPAPQLPPGSAAPPSGRHQAAPPDARTVPPPAGRPVPGRPLQVVVEAEQLVRGGATVAQGRVAAQPMEGFGSHWSGNQQLFWSGGQVGAVMDIVVNVPEAGAYAVVLRLTQAPDYADLVFEVDGKRSNISFSGFAPTVRLADAPIGTWPLTAGQRKISIMITGKHAQSTNYFVGVDRITLTQLQRAQ